MAAVRRAITNHLGIVTLSICLFTVIGSHSLSKRCHQPRKRSHHCCFAGRTRGRCNTSCIALPELPPFEDAWRRFSTLPMTICLCSLLNLKNAHVHSLKIYL